MTDDRVALIEALQKADDGNFLRSIAETVLQILMEADVDGLIGAGRYERSGERSTYRNGHRERSLDTRLGSLNLKIPKLRTGSYFPGFLEPRKTVEKALVAVIQEAWIAGVSTRRVDDLVQAMGLSGISKSSVSKLCKDIDERVNAFLTRPLSGAWPYLWLDATYLKVREGGRIVSVAAIVAVAVDTEGRREIVGLHIGPSEAEVFWTDFLRSLVKRGLAGVQLVVSDAHEGLKAAIRRVLKATWQRCRVHWTRNALAYVPRALDATYLKVREGGRIVSVAAIVAVAVDTEGRREIVGLHIGPSEAEVFWTDFLRSLVKRGLAGVQLVVSDAHEGLKAAIRRVLKATWQRCRVHWTRNALAYVPRAQQTMVAAGLRSAFQQPDQDAARAA
ncbi:IS256 family transposase [Methylorubrum populi]|uniref:Mutator family transposase n=1 Tax=Methylorubrum populi TaxID=223967 RepID=A0A833IZS0_9HYPH|nr:hypothetical protein F8B43_5642 [Methylorubrum populi]